MACVCSVLMCPAPIWLNAAPPSLHQIVVIETKAIRLILSKKTYEISNKELYEKTAIKPTLKENADVTEAPGRLAYLHQKLRCKLVNQLVIDAGPNATTVMAAPLPLGYLKI